MIWIILKCLLLFSTKIYQEYVIDHCFCFSMSKFKITIFWQYTLAPSKSMGSACKCRQFFVLFSTHNFTNSSLFNVCFCLTKGSLIQKNLTVVCYSIEKWFRLGSSLKSTCQSKWSRPSSYLGLPIDLHLVFENSSLNNQVGCTWCLSISSLIVTAKFKFEIKQKSSSSNLIFLLNFSTDQ